MNMSPVKPSVRNQLVLRRLFYKPATTLVSWTRLADWWCYDLSQTITTQTKQTIIHQLTDSTVNSWWWQLVETTHLYGWNIERHSWFNTKPSSATKAATFASLANSRGVNSWQTLRGRQTCNPNKNVWIIRWLLELGYLIFLESTHASLVTNFHRQTTH